MTRKQHYAMNVKIAALKNIRAQLAEAKEAKNIAIVEVIRQTENDVLAQIGKLYLEMRGA